MFLKSIIANLISSTCLTLDVNMHGPILGEFWIQWSDFITQFASIYVCRVLDEANWVRAQTFGNWVRGESAGGCTNNRETYGINPQFLLTVSRTHKLDRALHIQKIAPICRHP